MNAELQRIARRDEKVFLNEQCKEIEENNRMVKTKDLFRKTGDNQGNISCKDGHDKGQKWYGPNKQKRKRRGGKITELSEKDVNDTENHDGVVTRLEPDILECEVKWALGRSTTNKANGGDGSPAELFQILKDDAVEVLRSTCQQIWETQQWL